MSTFDKIQSLEKVPNCLGTMVIEDEQIVASSGELENNEEVCKLALKLAYTASKVPVNPEKKDSFKRISMVIDDDYVFMLTIANRKIHLVKRKYVNDENQNI